MLLFGSKRWPTRRLYRLETCSDSNRLSTLFKSLPRTQNANMVEGPACLQDDTDEAEDCLGYQWRWRRRSLGYVHQLVHWPLVEWDPMDFDYGVKKKKPMNAKWRIRWMMAFSQGLDRSCPRKRNSAGRLSLTDGHLLGTDDQSRDITARLIHGTVVPCSWVSFPCPLPSIGILLGLIAGFGGWVDMVLSHHRSRDVLPSFFLIIAVIAFIEKSMVNIMVVIGLVGWTLFAWSKWGPSNRSLDYVAAARSMGVFLAHLTVMSRTPSHCLCRPGLRYCPCRAHGNRSEFPRIWGHQCSLLGEIVMQAETTFLKEPGTSRFCRASPSSSP